jgi:hypothetical protein
VAAVSPPLARGTIIGIILANKTPPFKGSAADF